ncbi:hypothetical protein CBL_00019 [Carabus blaptoides fortunei]
MCLDRSDTPGTQSAYFWDSGTKLSKVHKYNLSTLGALLARTTTIQYDGHCDNGAANSRKTFSYIGTLLGATGNAKNSARGVNSTYTALVDCEKVSNDEQTRSEDEERRSVNVEHNTDKPITTSGQHYRRDAHRGRTHNNTTQTSSFTGRSQQLTGATSACSAAATYNYGITHAITNAFMITPLLEQLSVNQST